MIPFVSWIPEGLKSFLRAPLSGQDSLKRLVSWCAGTALIVSGYGLLLGILWQVGSAQPVDLALRDAFIATMASIAALAMVVYRKADARPASTPPEPPAGPSPSPENP